MGVKHKAWGLKSAYQSDPVQPPLEALEDVKQSVVV